MIDDEIAAAMKWAREHVNMTPEQFARELERLVPTLVTATPLTVTGHMVEMMEAGEMGVLAVHLVAAARIAEQPVSVILDELSMYETNYPALDKRLTRLEETLRQHGLA